MLEIAVLGLLKEQPLHGYELKKRLSETLGFLWGVSYGSLYPSLRRLEREGAIEVVAEPVPLAPPIAATGSLKGDLAAARRNAPRGAKQSRRTRKAYRITPAGVIRYALRVRRDCLAARGFPRRAAARSPVSEPVAAIGGAGAAGSATTSMAPSRSRRRSAG